MIMNGTGRPNSQPSTSTRLRPQRSASWPETRLAKRLDDAEADDERDDERRRGDAEFLRADERHDRALDPDHAADEGVDQDEQRELPPIGAKPECNGAGHVGIVPGSSSRVRPVMIGEIWYSLCGPVTMDRRRPQRHESARLTFTERFRLLAHGFHRKSTRRAGGESVSVEPLARGDR